jgi:hypothetical protein
MDEPENNFIEWLRHYSIMPGVLQPKATYTYDPGNDEGPMTNGEGMSISKNSNPQQTALGHLKDCLFLPH